MKTQVFDNYEDFLNRKDKEINGVSKEFAEMHPDFVEQNSTNTGCWNCSNCSNCNSCISCKGCVDCTNCSDCYICISCTECHGCDGCKGCVDSTHCINGYNCNHCEHCRGYCRLSTYFQNEEIVHEEAHLGINREDYVNKRIRVENKKHLVYIINQLGFKLSDFWYDSMVQYIPNNLQIILVEEEYGYDYEFDYEAFTDDDSLESETMHLEQAYLPLPEWSIKID